MKGDAQNPDRHPASRAVVPVFAACHFSLAVDFVFVPSLIDAISPCIDIFVFLYGYPFFSFFSS
jgi:hypothetical protein